tara:strand:- start:2539 stop:2943 length:405 start_codon:yes stop_codon:yes gene_type:complete
MASILKVNELQGIATANNITVTVGASATMSMEQGLAKVWYSIDGDAGTPVFFDSFNCASITDGGAGLPTINFTNNMNNDDFAVGALSGQTGGGSLSFGNNTPKTTGDVDVRTMNSSFNPTDTPNLDGIIMGDLA